MNTTDEAKRALYKNTKILWILSPVGIAVFSVILCIAFTLYPKGSYENVMFEHDYAYLDFRLYSFLLVCLAGFLLGTKVAMLSPKYRLYNISENQLRKRYSNHVLLEVLIVFLSLVISLSFILLLWKEHGNIISLLSQGMGSQFRQSALTVFSVNGTKASTFLVINIVLVTWLFFRFYETRKQFPRKIRTLYKWGMYLCVLLFFLAALMAQARYILMPYLVSLIFIRIFFKYIDDGINIKKLVKYGLATLLFLVLLFDFISYIRAGHNNSNSNSFVIGYTVASMNRLSLVLSGHLILPNSGNGFYILKALWYPPFISRYYDVHKIGDLFGLNLPGSIEQNFLQQFIAIQSAGLIPHYNWVTGFGYVYSDLGWFSWIYFYIYGYVSWKLFIVFLKKKVYGAVLYPIFAFSILFWFGDLYLVLTDFLVIVTITLFISVLERAFAFRIVGHSSLDTVKLSLIKELESCE